MKKAFRNSTLSHTIFVDLKDDYDKQVPSKLGRLTVSLHGRVALSTLKSTSFSTKTRTRRRVLEPLPLPWMSRTRAYGVFCINSNSTHTTFRKFMHWVRPILCHVPFSVHGSYTSVSTIRNFLAAFFSRMRLSSLWRLF